MKSTLLAAVLAVGLIVAGMVVTAGATEWTRHDESCSNGDCKNGIVTSWTSVYDFTPDVTLDSKGDKATATFSSLPGFIPGVDTLSSLEFIVTVEDAKNKNDKYTLSSLKWNTPKINPDTNSNNPFSTATTVNGAHSADVIADFQKDGILGLDINWAGGDFIVMSVEAIATGCDINIAAPVPEPGTMMLLGIGMLGMAVYGKRRMNREA
ncbi:MAG: PEP-CTERM sorting domain-containing protein [Desulfuromonadales bacterium]